MTVPNTVTREQAEAVRAAVIAKFPAYCQEFGTLPDGKTDYDSMVPVTDPEQLPKLVENWQPFREVESTIPWVLFWENNAPGEWAARDLGEATEDEVLTIDAQEFQPGVVIRDRAVALPAGVYVEPYTSYILCIYPDEG